jgi:acyl-CoA synthetase (NDP forming)
MLSEQRKEGIRCIFNPNSIAIIGASNQPVTWGSWIAKNVVEAANRREVYFVNPKAKTILGLKAYPDVKDIKDEFELAVLIVPADKVIKIVEDCATLGAKAIQIISGGFKEATDWGVKAQEKLTSIAHEKNVTIQGPNCNGSIDVSANMNTSSAPNHFLRDSPIGFATQSGYIGNTFSYNGPTTGVTFGKYVSLGNESDLTVTDVIEYFGEDHSIKVIMSYIEGLRNGRRFRKVVQDVTRKKPVVVYKVGEYDSGARAALSHTASIAGSYSVFKGLLKQLGVIQTPDLDMLPRIANAFAKYPLMRGENVAVLTIGAGWAVSLSDSLPRGGLKVPQFSTELQSRIRKFVPSERASVRNPIDFGAGGAYDPAIMVELIQQLLSEREVDAVVVSGVGEMAPVEPESLPWETDLAVRVYENSLNVEKPVVFFTPLTRTSSASVGKIIDRGVPIAHSIAEVVTALSNLHFRWVYLRDHEKTR